MDEQEQPLWRHEVTLTDGTNLRKHIIYNNVHKDTLWEAVPAEDGALHLDCARKRFQLVFRTDRLFDITSSLADEELTGA